MGKSSIRLSEFKNENGDIILGIYESVDLSVLHMYTLIMRDVHEYTWYREDKIDMRMTDMFLERENMIN